MGLLANNSEQQRQRLENIVQTTKSMSALISNLLFLARHEGHLAPQALRRVELVSLLQPLVDEYTAAEETLSISADLPSSVILHADPDLLQQAVRNLLNNACKYTPAGRCGSA